MRYTNPRTHSLTHIIPRCTRNESRANTEGPGRPGSPGSPSRPRSPSSPGRPGRPRSPSRPPSPYTHYTHDQQRSRRRRTSPAAVSVSARPPAVAETTSRPINLCRNNDDDDDNRFTATIQGGWLGSRVVSVLDSGAEGPGFESRSRRCRVTVLGKLFTPIVPLFTKQ